MARSAASVLGYFPPASAFSQKKNKPLLPPAAAAKPKLTKEFFLVLADLPRSVPAKVAAVNGSLDRRCAPS